MKRVTEKVRDIVEVCPFTHLHDFAADPGLTLAGYHFTDITVDLMAKWLDRVADVKPGHGAALALAGFRGVGKSHFLAVIAALVSRPELRTQLTDTHVASAAERLSRRHGPVASVRRGAGTSLLAEFKRAIAELTGSTAETLSDSPSELLLHASRQTGDMPLVILIDTALDRNSRVARDDGRLLSEIADAAKMLGIFVGVALDDDISGADGPNSSIAGNFTIDYLDQEHLYKIVDSHVFSKHSKMLPLLHDIYENYRAALPGFRWSEQRFSALYPLHPATLEIAPLIRLYVHDFALLGFASEAGVKILGRPANSLIGLDEVFDGVESKLRIVPDLNDTFVAFDKVDHEVVAKTPVQLRLQAKLILKGLLLLSLDGQGSTAAEIAAAMMIFTEPDSNTPSINLGEILDSFVAALPAAIDKSESEDGCSRYCFKPKSKIEINSVLAQLAKNVSDEVVEQILIRHTADKFSEVDADSVVTHCGIEWRGALRRGLVVWNSLKAKEIIPSPESGLDWVVNVDLGNRPIDLDGWAPQQMTWRVATLTSEEKDTIKRSHLLHTDNRLREQFTDAVATAAHLHTIAVEKVWQRVFLRDGLMIFGNTQYAFAEDAGSHQGLAQLLSAPLAPVFESQFLSHPLFSHVLGSKESSNLIEGFFSGSDGNSSEIQRLAGAFAFPLGLAVGQGGKYTPAPSDVLWELELVKSAFEALEPNPNRPIPTAEICARLQAAPYGLTRESQRLILAAMVAQRQFEFVTANGNRINHRSLDLQIIWDDIVGLAKPAGEIYSPDRLISWARLITDNSGIKRLERTEDRLAVIDSLSEWLAAWREERILESFDALPDENLNAAIWRTAANLRKSFGGMADTIESLIKNDVSLDECLHSIAERFSDSEVEYDRKKEDLRSLRNYIGDGSVRDEITAYLAVCDITEDTAIEDHRHRILQVLRSARNDAAGVELDALWPGFKQMYADHYRKKHDDVIHSMASGQTLKAILGSDDWDAFETVSVHPWFDRGYAARAKDIVRELRQLRCSAPLMELLSIQPFCSCPFSLLEFERLIGLPNQLRGTIAKGIESFRLRLMDNGEHLVEVIEQISGPDRAGAASTIRTLTEFTGGHILPRFTSHEIRFLCTAAEQVSDISFQISDDAIVEEDLDNSGPTWETETLNRDAFVTADS